MKLKRFVSLVMAVFLLLTVFQMTPVADKLNTGITAEAIDIGKVQNLTATSILTDAVTLTWDEVSITDGVTVNYRIYEYYSSDDSYDLLGNVSDPPCKITGLNSGTTYKFCVQAYAVVRGFEIGGTKSDILTVKTKTETNSVPTCSATSTAKTDDEQYLTIKISDDKGLDGYYWGKSSSYSENEYTKFTDNPRGVELTISIIIPGTYYITVKDSDKELSKTYSWTYYQTTLDANGGSVSPSYIISKSGDTIKFPTPTRSGYTFKGWAKSKSATSGSKSFSASSDATYYAIWSKKETTNAAPTCSATSTSNAAKSQTLTVTMTDDKAVAGYYWGKSSSYSNNTYKTVTKSTKVKTSFKITAAGTYYLTVKDSNSKLSKTYSWKYCKTILNANGGSVSLSYVISKSGDTVKFPTPTRSGYTFKGWAKSKSATSGSKSFSVSSDATYYAIWSKKETTNAAPTCSATSTSNAAKSQTLTVTLTDDKAVVGYYWGKSSSYSKNTYKTVTKSTKVKTSFKITAAGTYYLTVKDSNSKLSKTYSWKYCKTTLNANGGSVSLSYVISKSGDTVKFPTPTRSGYTFKGWNKSKSATSGSKSFSVSSSATYYAIWSKNSTTKKSTWLQTDEYSFANSSNNFQSNASEGYTVSSAEYNRLRKYVYQLYTSSSAASIMNNINEVMNSTWGGSCYGMSATVLLEKAGKTNLKKNYFNNVSKVYYADTPNKRSSVKSAINYYFLTQLIPVTRENNYNYILTDSEWSTGLKQLVTNTKNGKISIFNFQFAGIANSKLGRFGHSIVVTSYGGTDSDGNYILKTYDNSDPTEDTYIRISSNYKKCIVSSWSNYLVYQIEFTDDLSGFDCVDIDGPKNDKGYTSQTTAETLTTTRLNVPTSGTTTIVNKEGKTLTVSDGELSGTMKRISVSSLIKGAENSAYYIVEVANSDSFKVISSSKDIDVSIVSPTKYNSVHAKNTKSATIQNGKVTITGNEGACNFVIPINNSYCDMIEISGVKLNNPSVSYVNSKLNVSGIDINTSKVKVYLKNGKTKTVKFSQLKSLYKIVVNSK